MEYIIEGNRKRKAGKVRCSCCKKEFLKRLDHISDINYCSIECSQYSRRKREIVICLYCKQPFEAKVKDGRKFCCRKCKDSAQKLASGDEFDAVRPSHYNGKYSYRAIALSSSISCAICGYNIIDVLEVHHIDCNRDNNNSDNLIVLCPTHHKEVHCGIRELGL